MGVIPADKKKLSEIETAIGQYACGNLKIARDRIHNRVEQGGLILIKLEELDTAIKSGWVNRWIKEGRKVDTTGKYVLSLGLGDAEHMNIANIRKGSLRCAESVAIAWANFRKRYYENESNIYEAEIFGNPGILNSIGRQLETSIFHGERIGTVYQMKLET